MIPISINDFVKKYCKTNPNQNPEQLKKRLQEAVKDKKNGATCSNCGEAIWAVGSAIGYYSCFTCLTGDADSSGDYEIDEVCWC